MAEHEPYERLRELVQENVAEILGVEGLVVKAVLVAEIRAGDDQFFSSLGCDVNGDSLAIWDQLGLIHYQAHHLGHAVGKE